MQDTLDSVHQHQGEFFEFTWQLHHPLTLASNPP